jgi:hypothetical protein
VILYPFSNRAPPERGTGIGGSKFYRVVLLPVAKGAPIHTDLAQQSGQVDGHSILIELQSPRFDFGFAAENVWHHAVRDLADSSQNEILIANGGVIRDPILTHFRKAIANLG